MNRSNSGIKSFIETHILGLFGITLLLSYVAFNLLQGSLSIGKFDKLIILIGACLLISEFIPGRIKNSLGSYPVIHTLDKFISKYGILFLCFLIIIGFYLRFNNLGELSFGVDEFFTTYAAIGILQHGTPVMPSGMPYTRSLLNTNLIALSFRLFGISEFSARIVSVIFGTLMIPLVYLMGAKVANKRVGLLAAVLITFSVWEIVWAREARMYAQFQFFYLFTAYLFYLGLDKKNPRVLLVSVIPFLCAFMSHRLALTFLPVAVVYMLYILFCKREILKNRYIIYGILAIVGLASLYMIVTGKTPLSYIPQNAPIWGQHPFYYYAWGQLKVLLFLVFISIIILILFWKWRLLKNESGFSYLLLNFFIPFIILSIFPWKSYRYAFYIFPFLVLSASYAIDLYIIRKDINEDDYTRVSNTFKLKKEHVKKLTSAVLFIMVILLLVQVTTSTNAFFISQKDHGDVPGALHSNWKKGCGFVENRLVEDDIIITTVPLATFHYLGQADYLLRQKGYGRFRNNKGQLVSRYTGDTIILTTYDSFMDTVNNGSGWLIADGRIDMYFTDPRVRDYVRNNMTLHPEGSDKTIEVYSWNN